LSDFLSKSANSSDIYPEICELPRYPLPGGKTPAMATLKQIEAARRNGAKSRGPVTAAGKERSSRNALRHGLYSKVVVLSNESPEMYGNLVDDYLAEYDPATRREHDLVLLIANCAWRLNRIMTMETAALDLRIDQERPALDAATLKIDEATRAASAFTSLADTSRTLVMLGRAESRLVRNMERAEERLAILRERRKNKKQQNEPAAA
jgi:hypothetical protein